MCSFFWQRMEKDQGDLTDIIRATGGNNTNNPLFDWQFPSEPTSFPVEIEEPVDDFCDPFSNMRDPLLHELGFAGSALFDSSNTIGMVKMNVEGDDSVSGNLLVQKRPCNIFTRMVQISPNAKNSVSDLDSPSSSTTRGIKPSSLVVDGMVNGEAQISLPRNTGMKRRKNQAKKVVCIPAPAAANSRPGGEIVPSDLWAWRKYGQKPIKGSPYPRGYYRCSSSKGCPARKQVERSRTDPNMLVITYSSEHNHSWPTQRNALAGSTRSQPMRSNVHSKSSPTSNTQIPTKIKEEHKKKDNSMLPITTERSITSPYVKEEMGELEKPTDIDDHELDNSFNQIYRPTLPDSIRSDDFFADFGELETDPLNIMFSQGFASHKLDEDRDNKALDPFNLLDPLIWRN